ncbi:MAG: hypothetical protein ACTSX6_09385 [Candidatus Heimdallarchaeaceae archaeon]
MSDIEKKMNILIEEANANYNANRYKDAGRTFEHLISLAIKNDEPEEAIYFAYRTADCWKKEKNEMNRALIFYQIGNLALNFGAEIADKYAKKTKNKEEKAKAYLLAGECLLGHEVGKANEKLKESVNIFTSLANQTDDAKKIVIHLKNALDGVIKMKDKKQEKELKLKIASFYMKIAEKEVKEKTPESLQIALRSYEDALQLFKNLKSKEKIKYVTDKIEVLKKQVADYDPFEI